jgi:D-alanine-D-alanine ligase-like ATP-grasp enzyme
MVRNTRFLVAACLTAAMLAGASCSTASVSTPDTAVPAALASHTYDVRDLVYPKQSTDEALITLDHLAQNLREATGAQYWARPDWTVQTADAGYLVVNASPAMHQMVLQFLNDMRRLALAKQ